ncbi:MAG TPA: glycoside hydrolase family 15 protein [Gammaproteobacteria bacterium]|nr:glycoside hydrolase family 15 protein [Gammaproteobacteria bacterium]
MREPPRYDPARMPEFKPIEAYGAIGDTRTAALVGEDGSIDWACFPDFDSPAVFAALLDPSAGRFAVRPAEPFRSRQYYEPGTNILVTEFTTDRGGVVRMRDFMPVIAERRLPASEIHRKLEGVAGHVEMDLVFEPRFDHGLEPLTLDRHAYGAIARDRNGSGRSLTLVSPVPLEVGEGLARARFVLDGGERVWLIVDWDSNRVHPTAAYRSETRIALARGYWRDWISRLRYQGNWRQEVERSLLALKLLTYGNTGAVIAAVTAGLPEWPGGARNWDYRYTWVRDSAFILRAFFTAGFVEEGTAYFDWLLEHCLGRDAEPGVLYTIHGQSDLDEREIPLRGWRDSRPVRVGNGASGQFQLDIYGSLIDAALHYQEAGGVLTMVEAERLVAIIERVRELWRRPDDGIWEARDGPKHHTYSKTWAWVALDRGVRLARRLGLDLPWEEWAEEAEAIRRDVLANAYNEEVGAFTQYYGAEVLDAAVLVMPITGIISASDPRFRATRELIVDKLAAGPYPLLYRYDPRLASDGVGGEEGAFLLPSFWLVECLLLAGRYKEARATFEALLRHASALGLLSEEIHPETGELLGNFPQGLSHLGLINAALRLERSGPTEVSMLRPVPEEDRLGETAAGRKRA